jgi:hypothetical protein
MASPHMTVLPVFGRLIRNAVAFAGRFLKDRASDDNEPFVPAISQPGAAASSP